MSDDQNTEKSAAEEAVPPTIHIQMTREGLKVNTNVRNPFMVLGLLEAAKDALREAQRQQEESPIARVPFMPPGLLRNN